MKVEFREDVFKCLFGKKGVKNGQWKLLAQKEFEFFSPNWLCLSDRHEEGTKTAFPMKMRHFISWSTKNFHVTEGKVSEGTWAFQEKITVDFIKVAA